MAQSISANILAKRVQGYGRANSISSFDRQPGPAVIGTYHASRRQLYGHLRGGIRDARFRISSHEICDKGRSREWYGKPTGERAS
ncbi:MAG: hypothetical protein ABSD67_15255 [Terracidiphilus sp.]|jgi:hypothetical protein